MLVCLIHALNYTAIYTIGGIGSSGLMFSLLTFDLIGWIVLLLLCIYTWGVSVTVSVLHSWDSLLHHYSFSLQLQH